MRDLKDFSRRPKVGFQRKIPTVKNGAESKGIRTMKVKKPGKCINTEDLARYLGGRSTAAERERIEAHAAGCAECLEKIAVSNTLLRDGDLNGYGPVSGETASKVLRRLKIVQARKPVEKEGTAIIAFFRSVYEWIAGAFAIPTPVLLRSPKAGHGEETGDRSVSFGDGGIRAEVAGDGPDITVDIKKGGECIVRIGLENDRGETDSRPFRGEPEIFEDLSPGVYRLALKKDSMETEEIRFEIDGTGIHEKK